MRQEYNKTRFYDFGKGEDPYKAYDGKHIHPERTRREDSKLKSMLSSLKGRDLRDIVDREDLETRTQEQNNNVLD